MTEPNWGFVLMDVIKTTIPALVVFATIYFLSKQFFANQTNLAVIKNRAEQSELAKSVKLQAFERLMLYCDRMDIVNMALRLNAPNMTAEALMQSMMISIQKEYEHNVAQQIYVSDTLWKVISQAKSSTIQLISASYDSISPNAPARELLQSISEKMESVQMNPADQAKRALRSEAAAIIQ